MNSAGNAVNNKVLKNKGTMEVGSIVDPSLQEKEKIIAYKFKMTPNAPHRLPPKLQPLVTTTDLVTQAIGYVDKPTITQLTKIDMTAPQISANVYTPTAIGSSTGPPKS